MPAVWNDWVVEIWTEDLDPNSLTLLRCVQVTVRARTEAEAIRKAKIQAADEFMLATEGFGGYHSFEAKK